MELQLAYRYVSLQNITIQKTESRSNYVLFDIIINVKLLLKDMQQGHITAKMAAAATSCVCMKIHSGRRTSTELKVRLDPFTAWNMNCLILGTV